MTGTKAGGEAAAQTTTLRHGADFYSRMGKRGGLAKHLKLNGFKPMKLVDPDKVRAAGAKGGAISRRGKVAVTRYEAYTECGQIRNVHGMTTHRIRAHCLVVTS